jgi:hypothetical protein
MSERMCQLCGKPLSRIRVGGGEEFCSREHRTQYRLRRGMDRLQEANKVASLMRRRENPKPIAVAPVAEVVWRGYFQSMPDTSQAVRIPPRIGLGRRIPGLPAAGHIAARPAGNPRRIERHAAGRSVEPGRAHTVALPQVHVSTSCGVSQAQVVLPPPAAPAREAVRRHENRSRGNTMGKVVPPKAGQLQARSDGAAAAVFRRVPIPAREGMLLRVSRAVGFRLPARGAGSFKAGGLPPVALRWPELLQNRTSLYSAGPAREAEPMQVLFPRRTTDAGRWRPAPQPYPGRRPPETMRIGAPASDVTPAARVSGPQWSENGGVVYGWERSRTIRGAQLSPALGLLALATIPTAYRPEQRILGIPFGSNDMAFGYSDEEHSIQ